MVLSVFFYVQEKASVLPWRLRLNRNGKQSCCLKQTTISTVCKNTAYLPNSFCKCIDVLTLEVVAFYKNNNNNDHNKIELMVSSTKQFQDQEHCTFKSISCKTTDPKIKIRYLRNLLRFGYRMLPKQVKLVNLIMIPDETKTISP